MESEAIDTGIVLDTVQPEEVTWLWKPYIPMGKVTVIEGDPGAAKSWLSLALAAVVSVGGSFSSATHSPSLANIISQKAPKGKVVIANLEDGVRDTLRWRAGQFTCDLSQIIVYRERFKIEDDESFRKFVKAIQFHSPVLVVLDPIQSYLGRIDMFRANETRPVLDRLTGLAENQGCSLVMQRHLTKAPQQKALYRGQGSIDFVAAARSALLVGSPSKEDPNLRAIVHIKSSLAELGPAIGFRVDPPGSFSWVGPLEGVKDIDLLKSDLPTVEGVDVEADLSDAKAFLAEELSKGEVPSDILFEKARGLHIPSRSIHRARQVLGAKGHKVGDVWFWQLESIDQTKH